jgi:hypothetical protein
MAAARRSAAEVGVELGSPFLEFGQFGPQAPDLPVDARQLGPGLLLIDVTLAVPGSGCLSYTWPAGPWWSRSQACCTRTARSICRWSRWRVLRNTVSGKITPSGLHQYVTLSAAWASRSRTSQTAASR